jgi:hypothetical protein
MQDSNNLKEYSAQMLSRLRTSRLSPHKYYKLCECIGCYSFYACFEFWK